MAGMMEKRDTTVRLRVRDHRARLRAQGMTPIQVWVPDVRSAEFAADAHRQSAAVGAGSHALADQAFVDAVSLDEE